MLEHLIEIALPILIHILEIMGTIVITIGAFTAFYHYIRGLITTDNYALKHQFANSMATALEFKLSAEILKTVLVRSFKEILILGAIILLRALMTVIIQWEMKQDSNIANQKKKTT